MDDIRRIELRGQIVSPDALRQIWEDIEAELIAKHPGVITITMPSVQAWVLPSRCFLKVFRQLSAFSIFIKSAKQEWSFVPLAKNVSAFAIHADGPPEWLIIKRKDYGNSLMTDLKHELLHVYESILSLKLGTLTRTTQSRPAYYQADNSAAKASSKNET